MVGKLRWTLGLEAGWKAFDRCRCAESKLVVDRGDSFVLSSKNGRLPPALQKSSLPPQHQENTCHSEKRVEGNRQLNRQPSIDGETKN